MRTTTSVFQACKPALWKGRYARIPGDASVFHLKNKRGQLWPAIIWETDYGVATCFARDRDLAESLAGAVGRAKRLAGGSGGGAFVINEFGQVLVPASDGQGRRYYVGNFQGRLVFDNPFDEDNPIDLANCSNLYCGDPWKMPYVGTPYQLSRNFRIYFRQQFLDYTHCLYPIDQDASLIEALINVRGYRGCRFIVNHAGLVLTMTDEDGCWHSVYVGRINSNLWFEKEDGHV